MKKEETREINDQDSWLVINKFFEENGLVS